MNVLTRFKLFIFSHDFNVKILFSNVFTLWFAAIEHDVSVAKSASLLLNLSSVIRDCRRWTRATSCLSRIELCTEINAQCDKLHDQARATVASIVNVV